MKEKTYVITVLTGDNAEHESVYHIDAFNMWGALVEFSVQHTFARSLAKELTVKQLVEGSQS